MDLFWKSSILDKLRHRKVRHEWFADGPSLHSSYSYISLVKHVCSDRGGNRGSGLAAARAGFKENVAIPNVMTD